MLLSVIHLGLSINRFCSPLFLQLHRNLPYLLKDRYIGLRSLSGVLLSSLYCKFSATLVRYVSLLVAVLLFLFFISQREKSWSCITCCPIRYPFFKRNDLLDLSFSWSLLYVQINQFITGQLALGKMLLIYTPRISFGTKLDLLDRRSTESVLNYNYVDSSYVRMLFTYGIVPVCFISRHLCHCFKCEFRRALFICCDLVPHCN